ncbi:RtcB family protein [Atopococcus tabaci]|uniref:RtcB family protein n=1 Tax=Atopococcus tabaci TaxID=269774 RepID=UPI000403C670|nr:RtcB family protein [Atopococcus tabaci]
MSEFIEIKGLYNTAKVFNPNVDPSSYEQVLHMMNREEFKDSKVRFMPDIHYGKGATVGTTMTVTDKVVPNFIGVDIGCGVSVTQVDIPFHQAPKKEFLKQFDDAIRKVVPLLPAIRITSRLHM